MSDQTGAPTAIDQAVDDVLRELEQARTAEDYRSASIERICAGIRLAAISGYSTTMAAILSEASATALSAPGAAEALSAGIAAADAEGKRLLALIGVDLDAATIVGRD